MKRILIFIGCIVLAFVPAISGVVTRPDAWYDALNKPPLHPPSWLFAPVWTCLYLLIGIAHGIFTTTSVPGTLNKRAGHGIHLGQLALNAAWSLLFFGAKAPMAAGIEILVLLAMILLTMREFGRVSGAARWLLLPYLLWVCFATYLNWGIVVLNRGA